MLERISSISVAKIPNVLIFALESIALTLQTSGKTQLTAPSKPRPMPWTTPRSHMPCLTCVHAPLSPCTCRGSASVAEVTATSAPIALAARDPCCACREETALVTPAPAIPPIYSISDSFFFVEIVYRVSLADCLLIPDCPYSCVSDYATDSPVPQRLHQTCFLSVRCPHLLIIALPFTTICVATLPCVLLSRFRLMPVLLPIR